MGERRERPGVMLYFDALRPAVKRLSDSQCGVLLRAVLDYAQFGELPELDPMTGMAFDMLAPKLDRDAQRYEESRENRQYAAYVRERKKTGELCLSFNEWRLTHVPKQNNDPTTIVHNCAELSPSASAALPTSPTQNPSASPSASKTAFSSTAAEGEGSRGEGKTRLRAFEFSTGFQRSDCAKLPETGREQADALRDFAPNKSYHNNLDII